MIGTTQLPRSRPYRTRTGNERQLNLNTEGIHGRCFNLFRNWLNAKLRRTGIRFGNACACELCWGLRGVEGVQHWRGPLGRCRAGAEPARYEATVTDGTRRLGVGCFEFRGMLKRTLSHRVDRRIDYPAGVEGAPQWGGGGRLSGWFGDGARGNSRGVTDRGKHDAGLHRHRLHVTLSGSFYISLRVGEWEGCITCVYAGERVELKGPRWLNEGEGGSYPPADGSV